MRTITGYLQSYHNPTFGGLADVVVRDIEGKAHQLCIEAGFGTRQLVAAFGGELNGDTLLTYEVGPMGLIQTVTAEE